VSGEQVPLPAPRSPLPVRVAVLTISDAGFRGERKDTSGDAIAGWVEAHAFTLADRRVVPDETVAITRALMEWADAELAEVVVTTGGTGLTPRDVTPEATRAVLDREAPGIAEAIRMEALARFPRAALSRGLAGVRGKTLIVNLPGSPGGVNDGLTVLTRWIHHAVEMVRGENTEHGNRGIGGTGNPDSPIPGSPDPRGK
jgi:molybdopterin adenylyltransferase